MRSFIHFNAGNYRVNYPEIIFFFNRSRIEISKTSCRETIEQKIITEKRKTRFYFSNKNSFTLKKLSCQL